MVSNTKLYNLNIRECVEYFFYKHKILSSFELKVLIHAKQSVLLKEKSKDLSSRIACILTKLRKTNKIIKIGNKKWEWIEKDEI